MHSSPASIPERDTAALLLSCIAFTIIITPVIISIMVFLNPGSSIYEGQTISIISFPFSDISTCSLHSLVLVTKTFAACKFAFSEYGLWKTFQFNIQISILTSGSIALFIAYKINEPKTRLLHVRGSKLLTGKQAIHDLRRVSIEEVKKGGRGLAILDYWFLSLKREVTHFLMVAGTGGGKTQVILRFLLPAIARKDKVLLHDVKGDFTSYFPKALVISPLDARSPIWDISLDITNPQQAREFACQIIPASKEPVWSNGAREILTGYMVSLIESHGKGHWGWEHLSAILEYNQNDLYDILIKHHPAGAKFIEGDGATSQSFMVNLSAFLAPLQALAQGWGRTEEKRPSISFSDWLLDDDHKDNLLILQRSGEYSHLSTAWISAAVNIMSNLVASPRLPESRKRRLWFILDEFNALGKLDSVGNILDLGRSKGIRVFLAVQSINQLNDKYGRDVTANWINNIGTQIFAKLHGDAAEMAARLVGRSQIERKDLSSSQNSLKDGISQTMSFRSEMTNVILPSEFDQKLGDTGNGIAVLTSRIGDASHIINIPYIALEVKRPAVVEAAWLNSVSMVDEEQSAGKGSTSALNPSSTKPQTEEGVQGPDETSLNPERDEVLGMAPKEKPKKPNKAKKKKTKQKPIKSAKIKQKISYKM